MTILGKTSAIFSKSGKVYFLNWDFLLIWNVPGQLGIFSANWEKIWYRKPDPVLYREKALLRRCHLRYVTILLNYHSYAYHPIYFSCVLDVRSDRNFMDAGRHRLDQGCHVSITALGTASVFLNICFAVI